MLTELSSLVIRYLRGQTDTWTRLQCAHSHILPTSHFLLFSRYKTYVIRDLTKASCKHGMCENQHSDTVLSVTMIGIGGFEINTLRHLPF